MERIVKKLGRKIELYNCRDNKRSRETFVLVDVIGEGTMSVGYKATSDVESTRILIEFCPIHLEKGSEAYCKEKERFVKTAKLLSDLGNYESTVNQTMPILGLYEDQSGGFWIKTTWINARFLSEMTAENNKVTDYLNTMIRLLRAVNGYHERGLYLLGLKPEHVQVYDPLSGLEGIRLYDFGGLIEADVLHDKQKRRETFVSYSRKWSAPEVKREEFENVTAKADVYSIGLILYNYLFGKLPRYSFDSLYAFEKEYANSRALSGLASKSVRTRNMFEDLFRSLLSSDADSRATVQEALELVQAIRLEIAPKDISKLDKAAALVPQVSDKFILGDRKNQQEEIRAYLSNHKPVVVHGGGGVGKSEFVQDFAHSYCSEFDFYYLTYSESLQHTLLKLPLDPPVETTRANDDGQKVRLTEKEIYLRVLECIRSYGPETVLIIDNLDEEDDSETCFIQEQEEYNELLSLPVNLLCTSRYDGFGGMTPIPLGENRDICIQLLKKYLPSIEYFDAASLVDAVECNTLVVDIIGRTLNESEKLGADLSIQTMLSALEGKGDLDEFEPVRIDYNRDDRSEKRVLQHLENIYKVSKMKPNALNVLLFMSMFPVNGISKNLAYNTFSRESDRRIYKQLISTGWIREKKMNAAVKVYLHPAVNTLVKKMAKDVDLDSVIARFSPLFSVAFKTRLEKGKKSQDDVVFFAEDIDFAEKIADYAYNRRTSVDLLMVDSVVSLYSTLSQYYYGRSDRVDLRERYSSNAINLLHELVKSSSGKKRNEYLLRLAKQTFYRGIATYAVDLFEETHDAFFSALRYLDQIIDPDENVDKEQDTVRAQIHERIGELLQGTADWAKVNWHYRKAVELSLKVGDKKELARAHRCLGMALGDNGKTLACVRELKEGLDLHDFELRAYNCLGLYVSMTGLYEVAMKNYYRGLASWDGNNENTPINIYTNLTNCCCELGEFAEAQKWASKAVMDLFRDSRTELPLSMIKLLERDTQDVDLTSEDLHWHGSDACLVCLCALYTICKRDLDRVNRNNAKLLIERAVFACDNNIKRLCERIKNLSSVSECGKITEWISELKYNQLVAALLTKRLGQYYYLTNDHLLALGYGLASYHLYSKYNYPLGIVESASLVQKVAKELSYAVPDTMAQNEMNCRESLLKEKEALLSLKETELSWLFN